MEAIILAGGMGSRLQSVVSDVPKPMADIGGTPFLKYQIDYLISKNINRIILSVGYKFEKIQSYFGDTYNGIPIIYAIEEQALGTGGAIRFALSKALTDDVLIVNGDTYFEIDLEKLLSVHKIRKSAFTIAITQVESSGRYGGIEVDTLGKVERFVPKELSGNLFINVGTYLISKKNFCASSPEGKFSLEEDYFPKMVENGFIWTTPYLNQYFIDIGIPDDYFKAVSEIPFRKKNKNKKFLFLDRDGVINRRIRNDYVRHWSDFIFEEDVLQYLAEAFEIYEKVFVITNQRGIARGLMSQQDVDYIHRKMIELIIKNNGRIDDVFVCPHSNEDFCNCRKPKSGLFLKAKEKYPDIDFEYSLMIGDSFSDLVAAKNLNMTTVYLHNNDEVTFEIILKSDYIYKNLNELYTKKPHLH